MYSKQKGFTLIELVVVIVILGILAVTALPKFIDISGEAKQAAVDGVGGALSSAAAINYGTRKAAPLKGVPVADCQDVANALQGGLPAGYTIGSIAVAVDATVNTCVVTSPAPGSKTASFSAIGIS